MINTKLKGAVSKISPSGIVTFILLLVYCALFIYLFLFGLINSFKTHLDFINNPMGMPNEWVFSSWETMFKYFKFPPAGRTLYYVEGLFANSLIYAVGCAILNVLVCAVAAYATSQYKFKFSKVIYGAVIFTMIFPVIGTEAATMQMLEALHLYNRFFGMYVCKATFIGVYFMVFYATFAGVPKDFRESASVDGASELRIMVQIMFPMVKSIIITVFLIYFIQYWNDYQTPLLYMPQYPTISIGLYYFVFATDVELGINVMPVKLAACLFVFVPIFLVFVIFQKRIMGNISVGDGIKG